MPTNHRRSHSQWASRTQQAFGSIPANNREVRLLFHLKSTHPNRSFPSKPLPSPCHPDRSSEGAEWRDLQLSPQQPLFRKSTGPTYQRKPNVTGNMPTVPVPIPLAEPFGESTQT